MPWLICTRVNKSENDDPWIAEPDRVRYFGDVKHALPVYDGAFGDCRRSSSI